MAYLDLDPGAKTEKQNLAPNGIEYTFKPEHLLQPWPVKKAMHKMHPNPQEAWTTHKAGGRCARVRLRFTSKGGGRCWMHTVL